MSPYVALVLLAAAVLCPAEAEVVRVQKCHLPAASRSACVVHEVRVDPCPEALENRPCKIRLGANYSMSFDYTPTFSATRAGSQASKVSSIVDIPFEQMDINGCKYTTCPIEANKRQVYTYAIEVGTQFPAATHQVKWKLWNEDNHHQQCCFKYNLQLAY